MSVACDWEITISFVLFFPWFAGCDNCRKLCMPVQRSRVANMRCKPPDSSTFCFGFVLLCFYGKCVSFLGKSFEKFNMWVLVTGNRLSRDCIAVLQFEGIGHDKKKFN